MIASTGRLLARRSHEFVSQGGTAVQSQLYRGIEASGGPFDRPLPEPGSAIREMLFGPEDLASVRHLVVRVATDSGLGVARTADLVTAVNEIATNSLVHGGGKGTIRVWRDITKLTCEVRDAGRYDRPLADRERPQARLSEPRGLWVANQFCDLLQIRTFPDGTVVRAHMRRNPSHNLHVLPDAEPTAD